VLKGTARQAQDEEQGDDDDDGFGPTLLQSERNLFHTTPSSRLSPSIPNLRDLQQARELEAEDALASRKQVSKKTFVPIEMPSKLSESLVSTKLPHAEPGTHEGQLEKRHSHRPRLIQRILSYQKRM
jgi:hypothetical protein